MRARTALGSVATLVTALVGLPLCSVAGSLTLDARSTSEGVAVHITFVEDAAHPTGHPEWVRYKVMRWWPDAPYPACSGSSYGTTLAYFPRSGGTDDFTFVDPIPSHLADHEFLYQVLTIDAAYRVLDLYSAVDYAGWPLATTVVAAGTIVSAGGALQVDTCPYSCGLHTSIVGPGASLLAPLAGTGQAVLLYGEMTGSGLVLDHYEPWTCPTPVSSRARSWGHVKTMYR